MLAFVARKQASLRKITLAQCRSTQYFLRNIYRVVALRTFGETFKQCQYTTWDMWAESLVLHVHRGCRNQIFCRELSFALDCNYSQCEEKCSCALEHGDYFGSSLGICTYVTLTLFAKLRWPHIPILPRLPIRSMSHCGKEAFVKGFDRRSEVSHVPRLWQHSTKGET